ncbi:MAG: dipeptide ABC transporter ATP-binding protein [Alphaproteobacteria bacterium]|nr:dipeptide ABC transporter ATP-binding protein [Alphaproteobacteria bacterium]
MDSAPLLQIKNLGVTFSPAGAVPVAAVKNVSLQIEKGQTLAVVGESGSGKSVTALSIIQLLPYPVAGHTAGSSIKFTGQELVGAGEKILRDIRGKRVSMIFQEPLTSLNPLHTIGKQIAEVILLHAPDGIEISKSTVQARTAELLQKVGLENLVARIDAYPHQLSGGQRQRVMIAMALANNPDLLIADEPTTALDVTIQAQILELLQKLQKEMGMALLLISHDLKVVRKMADHIAVMRNGEVVEYAAKEKLFEKPQHEYTKMLLSAEPRTANKPPHPDAETLLDVQNLHVRFPLEQRIFGKPKKFLDAVDHVSFKLKQGETLGIVGESGSGKSTLVYALLQLLKAQSGQAWLMHNLTRKNLLSLPAASMRAERKNIQIVFQDPFGSLSPRMSVGEIIAEGLAVHEPAISKKQRDERVIKALEDVRLDPAMRFRFPHEFSGGQRQRIAIARALILNPRILVLDEPTSALDVSVQAQIIDLLQEIQARDKISYLFISHDLRVIGAIADHIMVMKNGKVVEQGPARTILESPKEAYTQALMNAALHLKTAA